LEGFFLGGGNCLHLGSGKFKKMLLN
jgi:hypothetical protein